MSGSGSLPCPQIEFSWLQWRKTIRARQCTHPHRHQQQNLSKSTLAEETRTSSRSKSCRITIGLGSRVACKKEPQQRAWTFFFFRHRVPIASHPISFHAFFTLNLTHEHSGELMQMRACEGVWFWSAAMYVWARPQTAWTVWSEV